jgi:micrococcal nuclease
MICRRARELGIAFFIVLLAELCYGQLSISAAQARNHVGERATVCGNVASAHYAARSRGNPTLINLDKPYPNQIFTVLIWGSDRPKFGDPEEKYGSKHICVTGTIFDCPRR